MTIVTSSISESFVFRQHGNVKRTFLNFSGLYSVYEKLRFRDGLVRTVDLNVASTVTGS